MWTEQDDRLMSGVYEDDRLPEMDTRSPQQLTDETDRQADSEQNSRAGATGPGEAHETDEDVVIEETPPQQQQADTAEEDKPSFTSGHAARRRNTAAPQQDHQRRSSARLAKKTISIGSDAESTTSSGAAEPSTGIRIRWAATAANTRPPQADKPAAERPRPFRF
jgi:hypothetical protein